MSSNFDFRHVPHINVAYGGAAEIGTHLKGWCTGINVLLVTDGFLRNSGLIAPLEASLAGAGYQVAVFDQVKADPTEMIVLECLALARGQGSEIVIGVGGGSSMDVAKIVASLALSDQTLDAAYGIGNLRGARLPLIQIPTTAGTGAEVTPISILTRADDSKMGIVSDPLYADHVLLDASLTLGLPELHTAATGIDAMVHAIEAYTSRHLKNPISDMHAREALRLLSKNIVLACKQGSNRQARENMLMGAMFAGQAFANAPVGAVHALAYPLGGRYHVPHGLSNALMLVHVMEFNLSKAARDYSELAEIVGIAVSGNVQKDAQSFIEFMRDIVQECAIPQRLRDVDIPEEILPVLARDAMKQTRILGNNPRELSEEDALALYRLAY